MSYENVFRKQKKRIFSSRFNGRGTHKFPFSMRHKSKMAMQMLHAAKYAKHLAEKCVCGFIYLILSPSTNKKWSNPSADDKKKMVGKVQAVKFLTFVVRRDNPDNILGLSPLVLLLLFVFLCQEVSFWVFPFPLSLSLSQSSFSVCWFIKFASCNAIFACQIGLGLPWLALRLQGCSTHHHQHQHHHQRCCYEHH